MSKFEAKHKSEIDDYIQAGIIKPGEAHILACITGKVVKGKRQASIEALRLTVKVRGDAQKKVN